MSGGGYQNLLVYRLAITIDDGTILFCQKYLDKYIDRRTIEQMVQASRSGKQCIVEGALEKSVEGNIKLTGVARASYGELLEDFLDYLRHNGLKLWDKNDPRVLKIRSYRESTTNLTNLSNLANSCLPAGRGLDKGEDFANLMICLLHKENYLLDQLLRAQEEKFIREGGFRENLFKKRRDYLGRI